MTLYKTSQVIEILEDEPNAIFEAHETALYSYQRARCINGELVFEYEYGGELDLDPLPQLRADWIRVDLVN